MVPESPLRSTWPRCRRQCHTVRVVTIRAGIGVGEEHARCDIEFLGPVRSTGCRVSVIVEGPEPPSSILGATERTPN